MCIQFGILIRRLKVKTTVYESVHAYSARWSWQFRVHVLFERTQLLLLFHDISMFLFVLSKRHGQVIQIGDVRRHQLRKKNDETNGEKTFCAGKRLQFYKNISIVVV